MEEEPLARLRALCLALPGAVERGDVVEHTFRVREKFFAMFLDNHPGDGWVAAWCRAPAGAQDVLVAADTERYFVPPYVGRHGWVGVRLDRPTDWDELADLVRDGYRLTAPKRLVAHLDRA